MADRVTKKQVDAVIQRSTVLDLLHACGIEPYAIMSNEEDLLAVKRYVHGLQQAVFEMSRPKRVEKGWRNTMRRCLVDDDHDAMGIATSIASLIGNVPMGKDFTEAQLVDIQRRAEAIARWAKRERASLK